MNILYRKRRKINEVNVESEVNEVIDFGQLDQNEQDEAKDEVLKKKNKNGNDFTDLDIARRRIVFIKYLKKIWWPGTTRILIDINLIKLYKF